MKISILVVLVLSVSLLSGCSNFSNWIAEKGIEKSKIKESQEYLNYHEHSKNNELDENGRVKIADMDEAVPAMVSLLGDIHITAAENSKLDVKYYYDEACTDEMNVNSCKFEKNDVIYVRAASADDKNKLYEFSKLRVWDIVDNGDNKRELNNVWDGRKSMLKIPDDYNGTDLMLEPLGEYLHCTALLNTYIEDEGENYPINCDWTVDGMTYTSSSAELDPSHEHNITVMFDSDNYYFVSDDSFGFEAEKNISDDSVVFSDIALNETECSFSVKLHKYIKCLFDMQKKNGVTAVKVNGVDKTANSMPKLKVGDKISIDLKDGYIAECTQFESQSSETIDNGTRVVFVIPEISDDMQIIVAGSSDKIIEFKSFYIDHATVAATVIDTGYVLKNGDKVSDSTKIRLTIVPDEGYKIKYNVLFGNSYIDDNVFEQELTCSKYIKNISQLLKNIEILK